VNAGTLEDLRQLKYRYLRTLDVKQWDEFAHTLASDVEASYGLVPRRHSELEAARESLGGALTGCGRRSLVICEPGT
jgi:hypothetical protein